MSGDQDETHWDTAVTTEPTDGILVKLAKTSKGKKFIPALPDLYCGAWSREEGKLTCFPFLLNSDWQGKKKKSKN